MGCQIQTLAARAEVIGQLRGPERLPAHIIAHRRDDAQKKETRRERQINEPPEHQHGLEN